MEFNDMFELNTKNMKRDSDFSSGQIQKDSPVVEIFSRMVAGKEIGEIKDRYNKKVDVNAAVDYIKNLSYQAGGGNQYAMSELNDIRRYVIEPLVLRRLQLLGIFGRYENVPYGTSIVVEPVKRVGSLSRAQANRGDVIFGTLDRDAYPVKPFSVAAGHIVDYRRTSRGDMELENMLISDIEKDMWNKFSYLAFIKIYNTIMNNDGMKFVQQGNGISQTALDWVIAQIRRFGNPALFGDFSVTSQVAGFGAGYATTTPVYGTNPPAANVQVQGVSQQLVTEFLTTGLIGNYKGSSVTSIENPFNYDSIITDPSGRQTWDTLFPQGILFVVPQGVQSPIKMWTVGGLTSMTAADAETGTYLTRFDLMGASDVAANRIAELGMVIDTSYTINQ